MLKEIPACKDALPAFAEKWGTLENYVLQGVPVGQLGSSPFLILRSREGSSQDCDSSVARPSIRSGAHIRWLADGAIVEFFDRRPPLRLNYAAAAVLALCNGMRTVAEIEREISEALRDTAAPPALVMAGRRLLMDNDVIQDVQEALG
jgi:hypothetical protein